MRITTRALLVTMMALPLAHPVRAQETRGAGGDFSWSEPLAEGALLRVRNYKGTVQVRRAEGGRVEVRAQVRSRSGRVPAVDYRVVRDGQNVTICAMPREGATCDQNGMRTHGSKGWRDASVAVTVLVPRGVRIAASSGNGDVSVEGVASEVSASSGNGDVRVASVGGSVRASSGNGDVEVSDARGPVHASTGNGQVQVSSANGPVNASSGNGDIEVRMAAMRQPQDMRFSTGNGTIRLHLPASFQGELDASTGRGKITSDFKLTVQGTLTPTRLRGTIGQGGPRIRMSTGNGSLAIHRLN